MIRKFLCLFLAGMVALSVFSLPNPVFAGTEPQLICKDPVAGNYSITFSWEQVPGAAGYIIYNCNTAGETVSKLTAFPADCLSYKAEGLQPGKRYVFRICSFEGTEISPENQKFSPLLYSAPLGLSKPNGLKTKAKSWQSIKLTWEKQEGADGYIVYRWSKKKNKYIKIADIKGMEKTSYTNTKLSRKTKYTYRIKAYTSSGNKIFYSSTSEKASAKTLKSYKGISLSKPVSKVRCVSKYGPRWGRFHKGMDFGRPYGAAIYAAKSGKVTRARQSWGGYGKCVEITSSQGVKTRYAHCSRLLVRVGQKVKAGQKIAKIGSSGDARSPHLHFEVILKGKFVDPGLFY